MTTWKEKLMCLAISIAINLALLWAYVKWVKPSIDEAAKGIASMMLNR